MSPCKKTRVEFTDSDDKLLCKFLAKYNPTKERRMGNAVYKMLEANENNRWSWSSRHSWSSWRERYKNHEAKFDRRIRMYQKKHNISVDDLPGKRPASSQVKKRAAGGKGKERLVDTDEDEVDEERDRKPSKRKRVEDTSNSDQTHKRVKTKAVDEVTKSRAVGVVREEEEEALSPPPPTCDYSGEIFNMGSSTEEDDEEIEVVKLVHDKAGEGSGKGSTAPQGQEAGPSGSSPTDSRIHPSVDSLPNSSNPFPATLPYTSPTPQARKGSKGISKSPTVLELTQTAQVSQPSQANGSHQAINARLSPDGSRATLIMTSSHKAPSTSMKNLRRPQGHDDVFASPGSPNSRTTMRAGQVSDESSDEDLVARHRRRRHQPPKIVESAFGRSVIARERYRSPSLVDRIVHEGSTSGQNHTPVSVKPLPLSQSLRMTPNRDGSVDTSLDFEARIEKLKQELAAGGKAEHIQRQTIRVDEGRHPFSQATQDERRTRSLDVFARDKRTSVSKRFSLQHRHPFSQSPIASPRHIPQESTQPSNGDLSKPKISRHPFSQLHDDRSPKSITTPAKLPEGRIGIVSRTELSPGTSRRTDNHHSVNQSDTNGQSAVSITAPSHTISYLHPIGSGDSGSRGITLLKSDGSMSEKEPATRIFKASANPAQSAYSPRSELVTQSLIEQRTTGAIPRSVKSVPSIELRHSPSDKNQVAAKNLNEEALPTSTLEELHAVWSKRRQNDSRDKAKLHVAPKQELESGDVFVGLHPDRSKPGSRTSLAKPLVASDVVGQRNVEPSRTSVQPIQQAPVESSKTLRFSSPLLAPGAAISSETNSPLNALTAFRLSMASSSSPKRRTDRESDRRRTFDGYPTPKVAGNETPRIDLSAPPKFARALTKRTEISKVPTRAGSSSTGAASTSSTREDISGARKSRISMSSLIAPSRRPSLLPDTSTPLPSPSQSLNFPISESDFTYITQHGIRVIIDKLAVAHGFHESVVWNVYKMMRDLSATEKVLTRMTESANNAGMDVIRKIGFEGGEDDGDDEDDGYGGDDDNAESDGEDAHEHGRSLSSDFYVHGRSKSADSRQRRSGQRGSLHWKPADENIEYSPSKLTRASEWKRLEMQGRTREALSRESKRASLSVSRMSHRRRISSEVKAT